MAADVIANDLKANLPKEYREGLTEAELRLLRAAPEGDWATCGANTDDNDKDNDPANDQTWGKAEGFVRT